MRPAEQGVAGGLEASLADHHALAVILVLAGAGERLEHRCLRLLDLEHERIVGVDPDEERDPGAGADAADADDLARHVDEAVLVEQVTPFRGERGAVRLSTIASTSSAIACQASSPKRLSSVTTSGGSSRKRRSPSTCPVSFLTARMLSFVRAFATSASTCVSVSR